MVASFKGGRLKGNPKFIADISSGINDEGEKTIVTKYKLEANLIVSALAPKDKMRDLAVNLGENLKKYLEKTRKRDIDRLEISNGVLKIFYK